MTACLTTPGLAAGLRDSTPLEVRAGRAVAHLDPFPRQGTGPELTLEAETPGLRVSEGGRELCFLRPDVPGPWLWGEFTVEGQARRGSYRLELAHFDPAAGEWAVRVSQVTDPGEIASPGGMGDELVQALGPFIGYCGARGFDRGWSTALGMVEDGRYKGVWQARAARLLVEQHGYDLVMLKWHLLDHLQHAAWGAFDPLSPWHRPEQAQAGEALIRAGYAAADQMIGELLPLLDQGVTVVVVSDHGHLPHLKAVSLNNLFAQHGLIRILPGTDNPPQVEWAGTQVYGGPALGHIWVNLHGRQPQGCVPSGQYEAARQRVIDLLLELRDPAGGEHPVALAVRREEARSMGLWGERVGDVVYWMRPGWSGDFNWSPLSRSGEVIAALGPGGDMTVEYGEGRFIAHKFESVHGCGDPAAALGRGTEEAILAMAGPGVHGGASLADVPDLTVVTPTLCAAAGLPRPAQAEGAVLEAWLER